MTPSDKENEADRKEDEKNNTPVVVLLSGDIGLNWQCVPVFGEKIDGRGWKQIEKIEEFNRDDAVSRAYCEDELAKSRVRYVFRRETRQGETWYKFHGVFELDEDATRSTMDTGAAKCVYRKIADECRCRQGTPVEKPAAADLPIPASFISFWNQIADFFVSDDYHEELRAVKVGETTYTVLCGWDADTLIMAVMAPYVHEWDFVQMYRGPFGWEDIGDGFLKAAPRKIVSELLLKEILRREEWKNANPEAMAQRGKEIQEAAAAEAERGEGESPSWLAEYRWIRNRMAEPGEGELRLYVNGDDCIWSSPIQCEWRNSDFRNSDPGNEERLMTADEFFGESPDQDTVSS